jgi:SAM-dependent methyltransferase
MVRLPPVDRLVKTGPVDAVEQYYGGGFGWVLRQRLKWVRDALTRREGGIGVAPFFRVLEIGYGSGIFFYELALHADTIVGADVHPRGAAVRERLVADRIPAELTQASGMALPFRDKSFDVVIIVSALEFMDDPGVCLAESMRVARPGGAVVAVTPRILPWADRLYKMLVGFDPESDFQGGRDRVQRVLANPALRAERSLRPRGLPAFCAPYELVVLRRPVEAPLADVLPARPARTVEVGDRIAPEAGMR